MGVAVMLVLVLVVPLQRALSATGVWVLILGGGAFSGRPAVEYVLGRYPST